MRLIPKWLQKDAKTFRYIVMRRIGKAFDAPTIRLLTERNQPKVAFVGWF